MRSRSQLCLAARCSVESFVTLSNTVQHPQRCKDDHVAAVETSSIVTFVEKKHLQLLDKRTYLHPKYYIYFLLFTLESTKYKHGLDLQSKEDGSEWVASFGRKDS